MASSLSTEPEHLCLLSADLCLSFKVKLNFEPSTTPCVPSLSIKHCCRCLHHLLFTIGEVALAFLYLDSFTNSTEPSLLNTVKWGSTQRQPPTLNTSSGLLWPNEPSIIIWHY